MARWGFVALLLKLEMRKKTTLGGVDGWVGEGAGHRKGFAAKGRGFGGGGLGRLLI